MLDQITIDDEVLAALAPSGVIADDALTQLDTPIPTPEPPPEPKPKKRRAKARPKASAEITPLPSPTAPINAALDRVRDSVDRIAPGVANALAVLERKVDALEHGNVIADVRAEVSSVKDYIKSMKGGYTMEVIREDDKIIRVGIEPK